jgi:hypothetical protein
MRLQGIPYGLHNTTSNSDYIASNAVRLMNDEAETI